MWYQYALLATGIVAVSFLTFKLLRWLMIQILFGTAGFPHLVRVVSALLGPTFRMLTIDRAQLRTVMQKVADLLQGQTVTYEVMGTYTAVEQQDIVEGIRDLLSVVLTEYALTVPGNDLGRLLDAVVDRALPATAA